MIPAAAIYARQSIDRPDSISTDSQVEFCRHEIKNGENIKLYIDKGFSGKNTDRPAFTEMMEDIENGLISKVIVYKLDRISRSILDFSSMIERFEKHRVEFISTTEKFDTSSPMGRAMLNICIVFAQLERETIQKRVADAYYSRSLKGLYMGGRIPFGFSLSPTFLSGISTSKYIPVKDEIIQLKIIFEMYCKPFCSYGDIARYLNENGFDKRGKVWVRNRIADILKNPLYVKADINIYEYFNNKNFNIINAPEDFIGSNGCYLYSGDDGIKNLVLAPHEGIINSDLWLKCRAKCDTAAQVSPQQKAKNTWLAGLIKCGVCGYALIEKHFQNRSDRYLLCSHRANSGQCPGPGTLQADTYEEAVSAEIKNKLAAFPVLSRHELQSANPESAALSASLINIDNEINSLLEKAAQADSIMFKYISRRIDELDKRKSELQRSLSLLSSAQKSSYPDITFHRNIWESLSFNDKRRTAAVLIEKINITCGKICIHWRF